MVAWEKHGPARFNVGRIEFLVLVVYPPGPHCSRTSEQRSRQPRGDLVAQFDVEVLTGELFG